MYEEKNVKSAHHHHSRKTIIKESKLFCPVFYTCEALKRKEKLILVLPVFVQWYTVVHNMTDNHFISPELADTMLAAMCCPHTDAP